MAFRTVGSKNQYNLVCEVNRTGGADSRSPRQYDDDHTSRSDA